jgi:cytochrome P450
MSSAVADLHWMRLLPVAVHPYRAYLALHRKFGDTVSVRLPGGSPLVFTIDDALIEHVLVTHPTAFIRPRDLVDSIFIPTVGDNVVASNGEQWATKRRTAEGHLDRSAWTTGFASLATTVGELLAEVRLLAGRGTADLLPVIERLVLGAAVRLVSGKEPAHGTPDFERFASAMAYVMQATQELGDVRKRGFLYSVVPRARDLLDGKRLAKLRRSVDEIARFEPDSGRRELLLATYENPSTTLTWALQFLASEPAVRDRIRQEARTAFAMHGRMTQEAIDSLEYTEAALREAARLRPAIAYLVREAIEDTTFAWTSGAGPIRVGTIPIASSMAPSIRSVTGSSRSASVHVHASAPGSRCGSSRGRSRASRWNSTGRRRPIMRFRSRRGGFRGARRSRARSSSRRSRRTSPGGACESCRAGSRRRGRFAPCGPWGPFRRGGARAQPSQRAPCASDLLAPFVVRRRAETYAFAAPTVEGTTIAATRRLSLVSFLNCVSHVASNATLGGYRGENRIRRPAWARAARCVRGVE